jgi:large subunit ribosomal protein L21
MFAVIKTGGKQYKVAAGDKLVIEKLEGEAGSAVTFSDVLMVGGEAGTTIGAPRVVGASVLATLLETRKGDKVMVMKKTRRSTYRRRNGHRQWGSVVHITGISTDGTPVVASAAAAAPAKAAPAKVAKPAAADDVSLIDGVGPVLTKKLAAAGVTSLTQIAAWTDADIARIDEEVGLKGRATNEEWVEQAKELLAGKPPRAKVDQAKAAKE